MYPHCEHCEHDESEERAGHTIACDHPDCPGAQLQPPPADPEW